MRVKLTLPQEALMLAVKRDNERGVGHACVSHYKPACALVRLGLAEWRRRGIWSQRLHITDAGKAWLSGK